MATAAPSDVQDRTKENSLKRKYVEIQIIPASELPFRVIKKRTGVTLGSFKDKDSANTFVDNYPLAQLESKPTRRRAR